MKASVKIGRRCAGFIGNSAMTILFACTTASSQTISTESPSWVKNLVIYEVATKAFTSPNGAESGTFESLQARLPYLQDLGITGIWLAGHSLSDPHHFYNIWTQYAVIEPDQIDPSLGTPEQFKMMVDEAHRRGIRIFLDVIDHGVMAGSSVITKYPQWFRGGSWGMVDYDYFGGHTDFDAWWVMIWTHYVTEYGVDGFRLDTNTPRPDLWARIRENAYAAGHPIVIWEEGNGTIPGVTDFSQQDNALTAVQGNDNGLGEPHFRISPPILNPALANDLSGYLDRKFGKAGRYTVEIQYADGSNAVGDTNGTGVLHVTLDGVTADKASSRLNDRGPMPDGVPDVQLTVKNVANLPIRTISIADDNLMHWVTGGGSVAVEGRAPEVRLYLATRTHGNSLLMSSHDAGWEGFPEDQNPFVAQGSRAMFGYSFLFAPMLPIFMSGEEFDATFHPLPGMSPNLFGGKDPGKGRWLYGAMLDWKELDQPGHREMLQDVKRMLAIRKRERALLGPVAGDTDPLVTAVPTESDIEVPKPYLRWNNSTAIVVLANRNIDKDAHLKLRVPLDAFKADETATYLVSDIWRGGKPKIYTAKALTDFPYTVKKDKSPGGGIGLLKIELVH